MESPVTVFRSADSSAEHDAARIQRILAAEGIASEIAGDEAPGVPSGAWEVRVAQADDLRASQAVASYTAAQESAEVDPSANLDLVTVFRASGQTGEMEALEVQALLDAGGIDAVIVGDSRFPNLAQDVRVPRQQEADARSLIADALAAGPAAAEEAEAASE